MGHPLPAVTAAPPLLLHLHKTPTVTERSELESHPDPVPWLGTYEKVLPSLLPLYTGATVEQTSAWSRVSPGLNVRGLESN